MPTYGYRCESCGSDFDVLQRMTDEPKASCPSCGAAARRLFFAPAVVFNGSGFYKTDSRSSTATAPAAGTSEPGGTTPAATPATSVTAPTPASGEKATGGGSRNGTGGRGKTGTTGGGTATPAAGSTAPA